MEVSKSIYFFPHFLGIVHHWLKDMVLFLLKADEGGGGGEKHKERTTGLR